MALLGVHEVSLAFGGVPLLDGITFHVEQGDRIGLVGRNGTGKSTLLALLAGGLPPDAGGVVRRPGLRVALLPQEVPQGLAGTVAEAVAAGIAPHAAEEAWTGEQRIAQMLLRLGLPADAAVAGLSGGMLRRVLLARALAADPDLLLLDEPTNHLDIDTIAWLEDFLAHEAPTLVMVTHDRALLRSLATRILELDRGRLLDVAGGYDEYLRRREEALQAEATVWQRQDRRLAEEEAWIRQGIKARRTRNEGRVRALERLRQERRGRRAQPGAARLEMAEAERSGRLVVRADAVGFAYGDRPVVRDFSATIMRGDRVGLIGPNGAGKTTLLRLLIGELAPQTGSVRQGTNVQTVYFDQLREQLDPARSVRDNLGLDSDTITVGGRSRHVMSYLQDFLFSPERARTPVAALSGGERNRLLLARLFTREANLLVLDEPTNDLDLETLDLLEELLADFAGTLLIVSHDRTLLDRVVTGTLALTGDGSVEETVGGYSDWLERRPSSAIPAPVRRPTPARPAADRPRRLTFRERRELAELPAAIERLEAEQTAVHARLADPELYRSAAGEVPRLRARLAAAEAALAAAYARWEELEALA
ncbi:MAG: ATP-binding cassette domain-containing protein [Candidatus Krumholzibacteriia bacterium]